MPVCANCHTDGQAAGAACRFCGAWVALNGAAGADARGSGDPRARTPNPLSAPSLELQIPPRRSSGTGMSAALAPATRSSSGNVPLTVPTPGGGDDDDDDLPHARLELDIRPLPGQMHTAGRATAQLSGVGISSEAPSPLSSPRTSAGHSTPPPVSRVPSSWGGGSGSLPGGGGAGLGALGGLHSFERTEDEAVALADYGDPPASFWLAPLYALRVHSRRAEIARELQTRQEDFAQAKKAIEDALVSLAGRARSAAEPVPSFRPQLSAITAAEELLRTRDGQLSSSMDAQNKKVGEVDARISVLEEKLAGALTEQKRIEAELRAVQERMQRKLAEDAAARGALGAVGGIAAAADDPRGRRPGR